MSTLNPLRVPWKISPSIPQIGLSTKSIDAINHGVITFNGFLGEGTKLHRKYGPYRRIAVSLERTIGVRMYPEFSPDDSARIENYDWRLMPEFRDDKAELTNYKNMFNDHWKKTDLCPDPSAYLVENSDWMKSLGFGNENLPHLTFYHYLFLGDDYNFEVIAKSLTWEVV